MEKPEFRTIIECTEATTLRRKIKVDSTLGNNLLKIVGICRLLSEKNLCVSTFWLISGIPFLNSTNLLVPLNNSRIINNFYLLPIKPTVVAIGQGDNSLFLIIVNDLQSLPKGYYTTLGRL